MDVKKIADAHARGLKVTKADCWGEEIGAKALRNVADVSGGAGTQVVSAFNLERWCEGVRDQDLTDNPSGDTDWADQIVCSPPPFRATWVEYSGYSEKMPERLKGLAKDTAWGAMVQSKWKHGEATPVMIDVYNELPRSAHGLIIHFGVVFVDLDADAKPNLRRFLSSGANYSEPLKSEVTGSLSWAAKVAMMAFQLMACPTENVPRELVEPPAGLSKKWRKKHGRDLVKYYTLDVGPDASERKKAQQLLDDAKREGRAPPRLHWVRGHFKRGQYVTAERPQGRYCRPFLRGSSASGIVVKDYNVRAPMESTNGEQKEYTGLTLVP
jgi:hypothetical protein